jgi:deoxyribodipyrimidine photo-lyase
MNHKRSLCWIRRDLRLSDHHALYEALRNSENVTIVFVYDITILDKLKDKTDRRITFIYESLQEIDLKLREMGSALITLFGDPRNEVPLLAKKLSVDAVYCNRDYEPVSKERDKTIQNKLKSLGITFHNFKDQVIFEGIEIATQTGSVYRKFTPYKNTWLKKLGKKDITNFQPNFINLTPVNKLHKLHIHQSLNKIGFKKRELWLKSGEEAANIRLATFLKKVDMYNKNRDLPEVEGTSGLSVHLRFGTISIRTLIRAIYQRKSQGAQLWLSELIWRDFYQMILNAYPIVVKQNFLPQLKKIKWPGPNSYFISWKKGVTGYPIIDAAMRHFNQTGWMHNRLRMIVASFLVKDLLLDWRKGEAYFSRYLLDFDLAANNGGWQWCASTGCDAQPWFRIFNPTTQSKRFDFNGNFIRNVLPEIASFTNKDIHYPANTNIETQKKAGCIIGKDYPDPIVRHSVQRERFLSLFSK